MSNTSLLLTCQGAEPQLAQVQAFLTNRDSAWQAYFTGNSPDLHVINAAGEGVQIAEVRQLIAELSLRPFQQPQSVFVILGADSASVPAQQALLKSLEEPPSHVQIILAVTQPNKLLPTILSRCLAFAWPASQILADSDLTAAATFWQQLPTQNFGELISESEQYKDRDQAVQFCQQLFRYLHQQNQAQPSLKLVQAIQICLEMQRHLEQNVAVRLALENGFFQLKRL